MKIGLQPLFTKYKYTSNQDTGIKRFTNSAFKLSQMSSEIFEIGLYLFKAPDTKHEDLSRNTPIRYIYILYYGSEKR